MTSNLVIESLRKRFSDGEYLTILEAPDDSSRMGRKVDLVAIALWRSRGLSIDAVEVKVSYGDWKRELNQVAKADFWWCHSDRFWIAAPTDLCAKIKPELPETWGLLACAVNEPAKICVKAPQHERQPLSWSATIGLLRAAADAGLNALHRAEQRGYERGKRDAEARQQDTAIKVAWQSLQDSVKRFEDKTGLSIGDWDVEGIGEAVRLVRSGLRVRDMEYHAKNLVKAGQQLGEAITAVEQLRAQIPCSAVSIRSAKVEIE